MEAPQSAHEIAPFEAELRKLDDRLRIRWNPTSEAVLYDATRTSGQTIRLNQGRWEIWITAGALDGKESLLWTWGSELGSHRPYRPITQQTVDFFREWDAAQRNLIAEFEKRRAWDEAIEAAKQAEIEDGRKEVAARFATDELGARDILGIGTDFGAPPESPTHQTEDTTVCQPS